MVGEFPFSPRPSLFRRMLRGFEVRCVVNDLDGFFHFILCAVRIYFISFFNLINMSFVGMSWSLYYIHHLADPSSDRALLPVRHILLKTFKKDFLTWKKSFFGPFSVFLTVWELICQKQISPFWQT